MGVCPTAAKSWCPGDGHGQRTRSPLEMAASGRNVAFPMVQLPGRCVFEDAEFGYRGRDRALDALEGLAVCAAEGDSLIEAVRLVGAAQRLREETSITYRSRRLDERVQAALAQAHSVLADGAVDDALRAGASLEWRAAAEYAARARGQRGRPTAAGTVSPPPNARWSPCSPTAARTRKSPNSS